MKIILLLIGKTTDKNIQKLTDKFSDRLKHYCKFESIVIPELRNRKNLSIEMQKIREAEEILKKIQPSDEVILLDERGKDFTSEGFSKWLENHLNSGKKRMVFIIGGPFGFAEEIRNRSNQQLALSKMTFTHEMIRPFFVEQLYRAFSIMNNEAYHYK